MDRSLRLTRPAKVWLAALSLLGAFLVTATATAAPVAPRSVTADAAYAWGSNGSGRLGIGTSASDALTPTAVVSGANSSGAWAQASSGFSVTCGLAPDASAYCWGDNTHGAIGNGTSGTTDDSVPMLVGGGIIWKAISAGGYNQGFVCGVDTDDRAHCWGYNQYGQLGNGSTGTSGDDSLPGLVVGGLLWDAISSGSSHTCAIATSGLAYCWGRNNSGQLGNGGTDDTVVPVAVSGGRQWVDISAGRDFTCGVTNAGAAYCWGAGANGQLGNGLNSNSTTPTAVSPGANTSGDWQSVDTGYATGCGIGVDAAAYCWGFNNYGGLGDGTTDDTDVPVLAQIPAGAAVSSLETAIDSTFTCATTLAEVYCWGENWQGTLGNPAAASAQTTPLAISSSWQAPGRQPLTVAVGGASTMLLVGAMSPDPPAPTPPMPASAPGNVSAVAGDRSAALAWAAPASTGSFPVTYYLATSSPGGRTCLTSSLSCTVAGLSNGTAYTFTVQALTGAGWSPASSPSEAVTPVAPARPTITITGAREGKRIVVSGLTTGLGMGAILNPWVKVAGQSAYSKGNASVLVSMDGTFSWSRRTGKELSVYLQTPDGSVRSNTVSITAR